MLMPKMGWATTLAWWQIIGGAMGLLVFLGNVGGPSIASIVFFGLIFGSISVMSIRAGRAILRGTPNARRLSIATQLLQLVSVSLGNFVYALALGPFVSIWYGFGSSVKLNWGWTGSYTFFFGSAVNADIFMSVNILSAIVLWFLLDCPPTVRSIETPPAPAPPVIEESAV